MLWPKLALETWNPNLQPVARVGGEERAAEHHDAPQNIFLGHLEGRGRSLRAENNPDVDKGSAVGGKKEQRQVPVRAVNPSHRIQWIIHPGGAQLHGPSGRFSRPSLCQSAL